MEAMNRNEKGDLLRNKLKVFTFDFWNISHRAIIYNVLCVKF